MKSPHALTLLNSEKLGLFSNLSTMVNAGLTLMESTDALLSDATGNLKILLTGIQSDITQGKPLHASLVKYPKIFDSVTVTIIKAAEESGTIHVVLKDIKNSVKKDIEFADKIKSALMYPVIIMVVFTGVLVLLLTFVIPKIATVFLRLRVNLPLPTKILIAVSNLIVNYTVPTIAGVAAVIGIGILLYKNQKKLFMRMFLNLPYISGIARQIDLTRFCRCLFLLLNSGIPISTALSLTQQVAVKQEIVRAIAAAEASVISGSPMTDGLRGHKAIPSLMVKIIEVGERSGSLDKSMEDLTEYFEYQVTNSLNNFIILLEPIILVAVGVIVGGMMMAIIAPMYNLIGQVGSMK
jgi:type II secretory pathway component PulF